MFRFVDSWQDIMDHQTALTGSEPAGPRRPELLAPAGGPGPFAAALAAGADAIYCGMGSFNARRKADNFTDESFAAACRAAHLAGARVYVTVNIVIKDAEMVDALELIRRCAALGADAFIIQDWGLFFEVRRLMPDIETHISTQANIHDSRGTAWCKRAGADRVTLSRELSLDEIAAIHERVDIDLEVFAHGSICFSSSGVCLLSSFACAGRSANRGMCAQPCRLPYDLVTEEGRVLSPAGRGRPLCPRDTCTTDLLPQLVDTGASALKLEGRMKAADYVFSVTDVYRRELDDILAGRDAGEKEQAARKRQLKRCFNRDFTHAYQDGTSDDDMMSYERSNNRGELVGRVAGFTAREPQTKGERLRAAIKGPAGTAHLALDAPVGTGDLLELRDDDDPDTFLTALARRDAAAGDGRERARHAHAGVHQGVDKARGRIGQRGIENRAQRAAFQPGVYLVKAALRFLLHAKGLEKVRNGKAVILLRVICKASHRRKSSGSILHSPKVSHHAVKLCVRIGIVSINLTPIHSAPEFQIHTVIALSGFHIPAVCIGKIQLYASFQRLRAFIFHTLA